MSAARSESSLLRRPFDICARAFAASVRRKYGVGRNVSGDFAYRTDFGVRPDFFKKAYREPARKLLRHVRQRVQRPRHVHGVVHVPVEVDVAYARVARYGVRGLRGRRFGRSEKSSEFARLPGILAKSPILSIRASLLLRKSKSNH